MTMRDLNDIAISVYLLLEHYIIPVSLPCECAKSTGCAVCSVDLGWVDFDPAA